MNIRPLAHNGVVPFNNQDGHHSESEGGPWEEVCDYAFVRLTFVYLAKLFNVVYLYTDAVFKYVLNLLLANVASDELLFEEVGRVRPGYLESSGRLGEMSEFPGC